MSSATATTLENVSYEKKDAIAYITVNRPKVLNALNPALMTQLATQMESFDKDSNIHVILLAGSERAWAAGADIGDMAEQSAISMYERDQFATWDRIKRIKKPIVAAVSGWCLGAGASLALTCHITIAADDAVFGQPQVRHAANTDFIWVALAGFKNALRYSLTGDHIDAKEALRIGLINQVVPKAELLETCFKYVERIAHVPPETVKINLHISTQGLEMMGLRKAWTLNAELSAMARLSKREEFNKSLEEARRQGGIEAFLRERDAPFQPEPFGPKAKKT